MPCLASSGTDTATASTGGLELPRGVNHLWHVALTSALRRRVTSTAGWEAFDLDATFTPGGLAVTRSGRQRSFCHPHDPGERLEQRIRARRAAGGRGTPQPSSR
jgi:hypothetical protein